MALRSITINPEAVRAPANSGEWPEWMVEIAEYVKRAASLGESVTLTAKRRVLTPAQVADLTGVSRSTISRKIAAGELCAVKIGNRNQIPYEEFERFWQATMGDIIEISRGEIRTDLFGD